MKLIRNLLFSSVLTLIYTVASAHPYPDKDSSKVHFVYDVSFDTDFDNREVDRSRFTRSMTIFAARLTPEVGLELSASDGFNHRLMAGVDVLKDFGDGTVGKENVKLIDEVKLYYSLSKDFGKSILTVNAGVFPRSLMAERYSEAFFSDSLKFYDNNLEGILISLSRPEASFELGCDWMGHQGQDRRERFMIFSSGEGDVLPFLSAGYAAYMYHYAGSREVRGVVDNILINPYFRFNLSSLMKIDRFSLRLGWLQGMQNDRRNIGIYSFPFGGEFDVEVGHWNMGIRNRLFYGVDMMPYYDFSDFGGFKYGNQLYLGNPFYRIHDDGKAGAGTYDRLEAFWEPYVGEVMKIKVAAIFHFNGFNYSGCQQMISFNFSL